MSEKTLDKLISTLKTEAIEAADKDAAKILQEAKAEAEKIMRDAEAKRDQMIEEATKEADATKEKGALALQQAARDLHVRLASELMEVLAQVLRDEVDSNFTPERIAKAVEQVIGNVGGDVQVGLPEEMKEGAAEDVIQRLQGMDGLNGVVKDASLLNGFSIAKTKEGWSYRITPEDVAAYLSAQLSPKWLAYLRMDKEA
jgi:V/A-type H+-transporting ATPase subunit E